MSSGSAERHGTSTWRGVVPSLRIGALTRKVARDGQPAADRFWNELTRTPLIVPHTDPFGWDVTFLWRGDPELVRRVTLCGELVLSELDGYGLDWIPGSDVWHLTVRVPPATRTHYALNVNGPVSAFLEVSDAATHQALWVRDPRNPEADLVPLNPATPEIAPAIRSVLTTPDAPPPFWTMPRAGVPAGVLAEHRFTSDTLGNTRSIFTYTPAGFSGEADAPLIIAFDGWRAVHVSALPTVLDRMIDERAIPPTCAVLIDSGTAEMRRLELTGYTPFCRFDRGGVVVGSRVVGARA
jgi:hypothetical protein